VAGAGFDAAVGLAFDEHCRSGGRRGLLTYFRVGLRTALAYQNLDASLVAGAERWQRPNTLLVAFANGRQYGGGALIAPRAKLDDGKLDVIAVEAGRAPEMVLGASRMYLGKVEGVRLYRRFLAEQAVLTMSEPVVFHRDGEPDPPSREFVISVRPRALSVLTPPEWASRPDGPFEN
jgi:diacylglycerol kinase family enzyme